MNPNSDKDKFVEYFRAQELLSEVDGLQFILKRDDKEDLNRFLDSIDFQINNLDLNKQEFLKLLEKYIETREKTDFNVLESFLKNYYKKTKEDLINIPNSLDKAYSGLTALIETQSYEKQYQVYDAMVLLKDIPNEIIENIYSDWKKSGDEIWISHDFMDDVDTVSHYRFKNTFNFVDFNSLFKKEEYELQFRLLEFLFEENLAELSFNLWLIDRIPDFINYNTDLVNFILKFIVRQQNLDGYWLGDAVKSTYERIINEKGHEHPEIIFCEKINRQIGLNGDKLTERIIEYEPSNHITALCSLNLIKHGVSDNMKQKGRLGAEWLLKNQNGDGSWSFTNWQNKREPNLFVTIIALETLFRSGIPHIERPINLGLDWINTQQDKLGFWDARLFNYSSFPLITVLILELNNLISKNRFPQGNSYLSMSKDFLDSSIRFLSDDGLNSRRLAIITAYHGIEFFLYSILSKEPKNIFDKNGKTIGMPNALNKFQDFLKENKIIKKSDTIDYKNSLMDLKSYRDNIIHKAYSIDKNKCETLVVDARKFVSKFSLEVYQMDILD
jgi:hypothetical protein